MIKNHFCGFSISVGVLFFAASLTPSLIPRSYLVQGILAGIAFSIGYGVGTFLHGLWLYLELPTLKARIFNLIKLLSAFICFAILFAALHYTESWQNSVRSVLSMAPVDNSYPLRVSLIAILSFIIVIFLMRGLIITGKIIIRKIQIYCPRRLSIVLGVAVTTTLIITLTNGVLVKYTFQALDSSFQKIDTLIEPNRPQPLIVERAGNPISRLEWRKLGRAGREFIASGPTAVEISNFNQRAALEPIRLYAGLEVADAPSERAQLLLEELIRIKAFNRAVLVVITPTGTGWVDPSAIDGLEYLFDGDVASVALQYSYLNSPLSLIFQPENGLNSSQVLFRTIYDYWKKLPVNQRPELYLHGLSLGAFNSQQSFSLFDILENPINGAVWSGPPFSSEKWRSLTYTRDSGSTEWLPVFQDGRSVRFMNQNGTPEGNETQWGNTRFLYLQYASDAITFFDRSVFYQEADWMKSPRGPDVSPMLRWYPVVSMLQLLIDMPLADTTPMGYGHVYAPEHYVNAWLEVTGARQWKAEEIDALKKHLRTRSMREDGYQYRGG